MSETYECPVCLMRYPTEDLANQCQAWCEDHDGPNVDIIKHALPPEEDDPYLGSSEQE